MDVGSLVPDRAVPRPVCAELLDPLAVLALPHNVNRQERFEDPPKGASLENIVTVPKELASRCELVNWEAHTCSLTRRGCPPIPR